MVNTNYSMVSTLAGLKRLEAQVQRAMLEASGQAPQIPEQETGNVADKMDFELKKNEARANSVMNALDFTA